MTRTRVAVAVLAVLVGAIVAWKVGGWSAAAGLVSGALVVGVAARRPATEERKVSFWDRVRPPTAD